MLLGAELGIGLPQDPLWAHTLPEVCAIAERANVDGLWVADSVVSPVGSSGRLDPLVTLAVAAGLTEQLRLGTAVLILNTRNPVHVARAVASLDQLSGGRAVLGVGLGGDETIALSVARQISRGPLFEESISLIRALWTQEELDWHGNAWPLRRFRLLPRPWQRPHPEIWIGGYGRLALNRAVQFGNGWLCGGAISIDRFRRLAFDVRSLSVKAGLEGFRIGKRIYVLLEEAARTELERERWLERSIGSLRAEEAAVVGARDQCLQAVADAREAGADLVILEFLGPPVPQLEVLSTVL